MNTKPKSMHCDWGMMRDETKWDKTDGVAELRGRLDKIREEFEAATEAPPRLDELAEIVAHSQTLDAAYKSALSIAEEGFERSGGGFGGGCFAPPRDERFSDLLHYIKRRSMARASVLQNSERETEFAAIDEAIATHRAAMPVDPDHGPMGNHEAEMAYEIRLLRAENERIKIKLSRMCGDA